MKWIRDEIYAGGGRFETKNIKKKNENSMFTTYTTKTLQI